MFVHSRGSLPLWSTLLAALSCPGIALAQGGDGTGAWLRGRVPEVLLAPGPLSLAWWQWAALPVLVIASVVLGRLLGAVLHRGLRALARRTSARFDDELVVRLGPPRNLLVITVLALVMLPYLDLSLGVAGTLTRIDEFVLYLALLWAVLRATDVAVDAARRSGYVARHPALVAFLPLGTALGKIVLLVLALTVLLQWLGVPVTSLVASLGIGGLAVALAAKTSLENLLGALTLSVDQPFVPGDFVKVDEVTGTIERVGLRSTRIRTMDRTLITLPNGRLADMRIESYTARDRLRLACVLSLSYETTAAQMRAVIDGVRAALDAHALVHAPDTLVAFKQIGPSSLDVEVNATFTMSNWTEFVRVRQEMYLDFLRSIEQAGTRLALPTQALVLTAGPAERP